MIMTALYDTNTAPRRIYDVSYRGYHCSMMEMKFCKQIQSGVYQIVYQGRLD